MNQWESQQWNEAKRREVIRSAVGKARDIFPITEPDHAHIDTIINKLRKKWHDNPSLRLGQLVVNSAPTAAGNDVFYVRDEDLEL